MSNKKTNASQKPKRYFGLHFVKGLAEYNDANSAPYKVYVSDEAINRMNPSFDGCPVFVQHVDEVDMSTVERDADGFVVKSFFNKSDGNHWAEFIVTTDEAHAAIEKGWSLSNAYFIQDPVGDGGQWHAIDYQQEVLNGEFEHLAIVPNPRYQESDEVGVLTPDEFKAYCEKKDRELTLIQNSKNNEQVGDTEPMLKFFKKNAIEDKEAKELSGMTVTLPKSKLDVEIIKLINEADEKEMKKDEKKYAENEHMVKLNESEEMSVSDLKSKYNELLDKKKAQMDDEEALESLEDLEQHEIDELENSDDEKEEKKENSKEEKKKEQKANFDKMKNAKATASKGEEVLFMSSADKVNLGKQLF